MGTVFQIPWTFFDKEEWPEKGIGMLRELGFKTAALALKDDSVSIDDPDLMSEEKLALILVQSFTKGSKEASTMMEAEEREAFQRRVERAKQEGEEAATRLLFPMIVLLCQVMLLVMYPALIRFQGF